MNVEELMRRVRRVELRTRGIAGTLTSGTAQTRFRGHGIEFLEVREYVPGDDTRHIDWNVTARVGRPYVKRYAEDREKTVVLLVDGSASIRFGSAAVRKSDAVAETVAVVALAAAQNNDAVGAILFSRTVDRHVAPGRGESHALRLIRDVLAFDPRDSSTDLNVALRALDAVHRRRCLVFLISDFLVSGWERQLRISARRHDLAAFWIEDEREGHLPDCGMVEFEDAESGEHWLVDTSDPAVREAHEAAARRHAQHLRDVFREAGVDFLRIVANSPYLHDLLGFLQHRGRGG
jgi:uncharacterized protein (DUF58 family)